MRYVKKACVVLAAVALAWNFGAQCKRQLMTDGIAEKIVRFHIRANSDAPADQALKLKVRDAVGDYMRPALSGVGGIEEGRRAIRRNLAGIKARAEEVIREEGYGYDVSASLAVTDFPEKTYGEYTFPAGRYEALEVVIGRGEGHNWWCVMYPNLCFFNSTYGVVGKEAERSLERVLSQDEYESLMEHKDYKIRSAFLEFLEEFLG